MKSILLLSLPVFAAACSASAPAGNASADVNIAAVQAQSAIDAYGANEPVEIGEPDAIAEANGTVAENAQQPLAPPPPGTPGGLADDRTPVSEASFADDSAQGAATVVEHYYALIGAKRYAQAFALRETGTDPRNFAAFVAAFARFSEYHANVGAPGAIDAGAGQRYVTVPVQIYARLKHGGAPAYQIGSVTLHRVGDVDGASAEQRSWHIRAVDLKPASNQ